MLFMLLVKASANSEAGGAPSEQLRQQMDSYNQALEAAGVRVMAKGLHPTSEALRIFFPAPGQKPVVTEGPFLPAREQIAGFFLLEVESKEEAMQWALRAPDPQGFDEGQVEFRQVFE